MTNSHASPPAASAPTLIFEGADGGREQGRPLARAPRRRHIQRHHDWIPHGDNAAAGAPGGNAIFVAARCRSPKRPRRVEGEVPEQAGCRGQDGSRRWVVDRRAVTVLKSSRRDSQNRTATVPERPVAANPNRRVRWEGLTRLDPRSRCGQSSPRSGGDNRTCLRGGMLIRNVKGLIVRCRARRERR